MFICEHKYPFHYKCGSIISQTNLKSCQFYLHQHRVEFNTVMQVDQSFLFLTKRCIDATFSVILCEIATIVLQAFGFFRLEYGK
jgi:hypothetical protein